MRNITTNWS